MTDVLEELRAVAGWQNSRDAGAQRFANLLCRLCFEFNIGDQPVIQSCVSEDVSDVAHTLGYARIQQAPLRLDVNDAYGAVATFGQKVRDIGTPRWTLNFHRLAAVARHLRIDFEANGHLGFKASLTGDERPAVFPGWEQHYPDMRTAFSESANALENIGAVGRSIEGSMNIPMDSSNSLFREI